MPEISWNSVYFDGEYDWSSGGEEWSQHWGGSEAQWFGSLYPRLHRLLPTERILEIAPGFGRWTRFLLPVCKSYVGIDISGGCIAACQDRFKDNKSARFYQNDGLSLDMADGTFDLIFSFDSLVHAEDNVIAAYIPQIMRKLRAPTGVAFVHHSNIAGLPVGTEIKHARAASVSAGLVADLVAYHGGKIIVQECVNWDATSLDLTDCFSLFGREDHPNSTVAVQLKNPRYMDEAVIIREAQSPYSS